MIEVFKELIISFKDYRIKSYIPREINIPLKSSKIISIIGARRTGKTYLLFSVYDRIRKEIPEDRIVYINFEDDRLFGLKISDLQSLISAYYELYPGNRDKTVYFLFDEIQNVKNWELFIRRVYDTENCRIYLTGSSSKLLSKEISTSLRGRTISYELFPYSFTEYLKSKKIDIDVYSQKKISYIKKAFDDYLKKSSFPELVNLESDEMRLSLQEYLNMVIYKDIVERHNVQNVYLIKSLIKFIFSNVSSLISINKIYNDFKSQGYTLSKDILHKYFGYLEDSYSVFMVPVFTKNLKELNRNPRKIYTIDNGLSCTMNMKVDIGKQFENLAYMHLRRQCRDISYFKDIQEVDFVTENSNRINLTNVCYNMQNSQTRERELSGMFEALKKLKVKKGIIITNDETDKIEKSGKQISILPMWKWLLET